MRLVLLVMLVSLVGGCGADREVAADVSQQDAIALAGRGALLLDVRSPEEYASGHVPGAVNIPYDELSARIDEIGARRDDSVVVYCERGPRASKAAATLRDAGFSSIQSLTGHMSAWRAAGLPVER